MDYVGQLLTKTIKLSSIDEAKLLKRKASLDDQISLLETLQKDIAVDLRNQKIIHVVGVVTILVSMVSDILIDTAGQMVRKTNKVFDIAIDKGYNKARSQKWDGNSQKELIDKVNKNAGYLQGLIKAAGGKAAEPLLMVLEVHKNMATNMVGLIGFDADAQDARSTLERNLSQMHKLLVKLRKDLSSTDFYLQTGEGPAPQQRFTPASARPGPA